MEAPLDESKRPSFMSLMGSRSALDLLAPLVGLAIIFALWIVGGWQGWARGFVIYPWDALEPVFAEESSERYWRAMKATLWAASRGLLIGGSLAFIAALVAAGVPGLRRSIVRLAAIANAAPWVAIAPCLIMLLGRERGPTAVAALAVFFFVFISTTVGLGAAPAAAHDVATVLGASRLRRVWSVQLPAAWPSIADGMKLAAPAALAGAVFGEFYGTPPGLGVLLIGAMQAARPPALWAASLLVAALGLVAYALFSVVRTMAVRRYGAAIVEGVEPRKPLGYRLRALVIEPVAIVGLAATLVAAWWLWIELAGISPIVVPRPSSVWDDITSFPGEYAAAAGDTLVNAAVALPLGAAVGVLMALAASRSRLLSGTSVPFAVILSAMPLVALFPLFSRIFGYGDKTLWVLDTVRILGAVIVFYPMFIYTRSGLSAASQSSLDVVDSLGGAPGSRFRLVVLPAAVPHIASGLRIAVGSAVIAAVVGEFLIGRSGLGVEFSYAYSLLDLPRAFGAALVIIVVSLLVFGAGGKFEQAVHSRWV